MRLRRRRRSSSRASGGGLATLENGRARRSGGDADPGTPRTLPRGRLGAGPAVPRSGELGDRRGGGSSWGDGGCSRAALSLPAGPGRACSEAETRAVTEAAVEGPRTPSARKPHALTDRPPERGGSTPPGPAPFPPLPPSAPPHPWFRPQIRHRPLLGEPVSASRLRRSHTPLAEEGQVSSFCQLGGPCTSQERPVLVMPPKGGFCAAPSTPDDLRQYAVSFLQGGLCLDSSLERSTVFKVCIRQAK